MNKVALITGSAERLGAATATFLHKNDWNVVIHYRSKANAAEKLVSELNHVRADSAFAVKADLSSDTNLTYLAQTAREKWGRVDALINNASSFYPTAVTSASFAQWDDLFASNARAPFFLSQALLPELKKSQGSIINMVDIHASKPLADHSIYCMAKASLLMMTKALAKELAPEVRVNAIAPGAILWPENIPEEAAQQKIINGIPMQQLGTPLDIARSIYFLLENAPYITGQILAVDGGRSL